MLILMKIMLTLLCLGMFFYAWMAIKIGRVYCQGRWYERFENGSWFWSTIALYLLGPPVILYLLWKF